MSWILAFLGFAALVILHEAGHFAAAKAVDMRVEKFSLFFGPMLAKVQRGETTYGIGPIPLGGYVKISGMNPAEELPPEVAHRAYYRQPPWKRIVVIAAGPAVNVVLAFGIAVVVLALHHPIASDRVVAIEKGSPAAGALRADDRIVSVDGRRGDITTLSRQIASHRCAGRPTAGCRAATPARVVVARDGTRRALEITPRYDAKADPPRTRIGFQFGSRFGTQGIVPAAGDSASTLWRVSKLSVAAIVRIFYDSRARKEVSGVVGSYEVTRQAIAFDGWQAAYILAIISLSLAIINLFPFLPLDGGHIFWAVAEKVRGRAIPFSVMERAGVVGFMLVIVLFAIGLTNDIGRIRGEGFGIR